MNSPFAHDPLAHHLYECVCRNHEQQARAALAKMPLSQAMAHFAGTGSFYVSNLSGAASKFDLPCACIAQSRFSIFKALCDRIPAEAFCASPERIGQFIDALAKAPQAAFVEYLHARGVDFSSFPSFFPSIFEGKYADNRFVKETALALQKIGAPMHAKDPQGLDALDHACRCANSQHAQFLADIGWIGQEGLARRDILDPVLKTLRAAKGLLDAPPKISGFERLVFLAAAELKKGAPAEASCADKKPRL